MHFFHVSISSRIRIGVLTQGVTHLSMITISVTCLASIHAIESITRAVVHVVLKSVTFCFDSSISPKQMVGLVSTFVVVACGLLAGCWNGSMMEVEVVMVRMIVELIQFIQAAR